MAIKCYTTKVPAAQSVAEIERMLAKRGASGILFEYEKGTGRIASLSFKIDIRGNSVGFRLPLRCEQARKSLIDAGQRRAEKDDDYVYRVAWRIIREWVDAQMAIYDLEMVALEEIFLPYAIMKDGRTMFDHVAADPSRMLGAGTA